MLVALASLVAACGTARRGEPLRGPLELNEAEHRGELVFMRICQKCHPGGEGGLGLAINDKPLPTFLKRFQVRHGLGAMPKIPEQAVSKESLNDLMAYLSAVKKNG